MVSSAPHSKLPPGVTRYTGPLDTKKMSPIAKTAYQIWAAQRCRNTVDYGSRDFISWWIHYRNNQTWHRPACGRIDHDKGYSFDNIVMQEQADNNRERNDRRGNPVVRKGVMAISPSGGKKFFISKKDAALYYGISEKTVYNHCQGRTKTPWKFGPGAGQLIVRFQWST